MSQAPGWNGARARIGYLGVGRGRLPGRLGLTGGVTIGPDGQ
jgi:hypothetical protein